MGADPRTVNPKPDWQSQGAQYSGFRSFLIAQKFSGRQKDIHCISKLNFWIFVDRRKVLTTMLLHYYLKDKLSRFLVQSSGREMCVIHLCSWKDPKTIVQINSCPQARRLSPPLSFIIGAAQVSQVRWESRPEREENDAFMLGTCRRRRISRKLFLMGLNMVKIL